MSADLIANKYKILREIARSNDIVYEALDTAMGRRVAVKELNVPPNLTGQARRDRIERFNREARAAGKLTHPNIVTVYDFGEADGRHFIAMEFLEGGTLRDMLQARGALPVNEAIDIACQVLSALSHAHARQVVHRDVKPDNIHMLPTGGVKLTDFGIARLTEEASLTSDGQVFGTPSYMSPEQIEGKAIDHRSDLFSLGVMLYEMLAGRKPFTGDSVISITHAIMTADPPPMAGVPYGLEQAVLRALSKDPLRRYSSAEEMRQALKQAESAPAMFFPRQPTNLGTPLPQTGYGMPSIGMGVPQPQYNPPPAYGVPAPASPPFTVVGTAYAPPPQSAQPAPSAGPFVNWGAAGQSQPQPYAQPPAVPQQYLPRPSGPLITEGTRTFLSLLLLTVLISGGIVGMVLLFLRAYDQQHQMAPARAAAVLVQDGNTLHDRGDLAGAARKFEEAMNKAPDSDPGKVARKNLAITLDEQGIRAYKQHNPPTSQDIAAASDFWYRANSIDPDNQDVQHNLQVIYDRTGTTQDTLRDWQTSSANGRIPGSNPGAPGDTDSLQARIERARSYLLQGNTAAHNGDVGAARDQWQKAVQEAPGSDVALQAQQYLDQTTAPPNF